ncbi:MAG: Nif3-like dinuclear metal center hexameric protein [Bdellovibrionales bacterium]|nr:Nif3-like dinuclear metal center hexameric protein [Bdellovibrionales bacterium]
MAKAYLPTVSELIDAIESRIPPSCSEGWDQVGLVVGNQKASVTGVVIGVDLTERLLEQAKRNKCNFIVIHHPPLFPRGRGMTRLMKGKSNDLSTLLLEAYEQKVAVYVAHTNFDRCALDGMIQLASDLGGVVVGRVWEQPDEGRTLLKKLVTYVPAHYFEKVRDALYSVGCGHIGNYDSCGFGSAGIGNYRPLQGANPFHGEIGNLETVDEVRFETLVVTGMEDIALETLKSVHPYEEVAYDLYPVLQNPAKLGMVWGLGYGFVAKLKKPMSFSVFTSKVKNVFKCDTILTSQHQPKMVSKIAFTPGKGSSFLKSARAHGVDVYITGEVGYHGSVDAARQGLSVFELGHRESEHYFLKTFAAWCKEWGLKHATLDERTQRFL